jgi:PAS domain S-box-containing protein
MSWFGNLHLRTKFNLIMSLLLVCLFLAAAFLTYRKQQQLIFRFAEDSARNLARQIIETRDYMSGAVRDEAENNYDLVPQVVATRVAKRITAGSPYYVRQVSLRYRNPDNRPDSYETARLENFSLKGPAEVSAMETVDGKLTFRYLQPMVAVESCLACHGDYDKAPAFVRTRFPRGHYSYNYKVGEIIGAVSVSVPMADLYRQIGANLRQDLLYRGVIFCIVILVMGWILRRSIIDPVKQVAMSISRVTRTGSYSERLSRLTNDEIGTLVGSFNELMQELEQKNQQSSEADARYRSFIEIVPSAVVTCLQDGRIITSNQRAEKLFGVPRKDLLGKSIFDFITGEAARNELFATRLKDGRIKLVTENSLQTVRDFRRRLIQMEVAVAASEEGDQQPLFTVILHGILTS